MRRDQERLWRGSAAPQALAILSCALALLVAQPPAAHGHVVVAAPAIKSLSVDGAVLSHAERGRCESVPVRSPLVSPRLFFTSARRLHVLATMDILHRILMGELQTAPRVALGGISHSFGLLCFVQPPPLLFLTAFQRVEQFDGLSVERLCVRLRSQLAPPSV